MNLNKELKSTQSVIYEILGYYIIFIFIFTSFRVAVFLKYGEIFDQLSAHQIILSFLEGLRFDLASTTALLIIPFLILIFPLKITGNS